MYIFGKESYEKHLRNCTLYYSYKSNLQNTFFFLWVCFS